MRTQSKNYPFVPLKSPNWIRIRMINIQFVFLVSLLKSKKIVSETLPSREVFINFNLIVCLLLFDPFCHFFQFLIRGCVIFLNELRMTLYHFINFFHIPKNLFVWVEKTRTQEPCGGWLRFLSQNLFFRTLLSFPFSDGKLYQALLIER